MFDIAGPLSLTTGGVSKLVDAIEESGNCTRRPDPDDRRSSIIELMPGGRKALARATRTFDAELELRCARRYRTANCGRSPYRSPFCAPRRPWSAPRRPPDGLFAQWIRAVQSNQAQPP